jgi:DNA-binding protein H-NS
MRNLKSLTIDELWILHEEVRALLASKLDAQKQQLEHRLAQLSGHSGKERRPYPRVIQKYRNPDRPIDTWSGRGKRPHWVGKQLRMGKKIEDLLVS